MPLKAHENTTYEKGDVKIYKRKGMKAYVYVRKR